MMIHEMTQEECRLALGRIDCGRLACARDNQPYIVPVHFSFDGQNIYGVTTLGQKVEWMRANPNVCLEIDERRDHYDWMSIIVFGRYEEISDRPEFQEARAYALEALQRRTLWWEPACVPAEGQEPRQPIFYRIAVSHMSGRRAHDH